MEVQMRWSYVIPRLIIIGLIYAFFALGFDPIVRSSLTSSLQSVTGARADIDSLRTGFFPPEIRIGRTELASRRRPGTNLVQFDEFRFRLAGDSLLRRSFVLEEAALNGVRFGTTRNDNGQLETQVDEPSGPVIPEWITDKLTHAGDEWLANLSEQLQQQLDPDSLATYRVGKELYGKWDTRFESLSQQLSDAKSELNSLRRQIEAAKSGATVEQIEKYLEVARRADVLMQESRQLLSELKTKVPQEIKTDYSRLDSAQQFDRQRVSAVFQMFKQPDARRISESLIGEDMYLQLHQLLSWIEFLRDYQQDLKAPIAEENSRGRDFSFPLLNPTPRVLCRKMAISGEVVLGDLPAPFAAVLTDVTSDPKLHGRPAILKVTTEGETPMEVVVRHDATGPVATTDLGVDYSERVSRELIAGKAEADHIRTSLSDLHWTARLSLSDDQLNGRIDLRGALQAPRVELTHRLAGSFARLAEESLGSISEVSATLHMTGDIRKPSVTVTSDIGSQFANGFRIAFAEFVPAAKQQLVAEIDSYVTKQKAEFSEKYGARYQKLLGEHQEILDGLQEAQQIAMQLRSGRIDADRMFRLASESGMLKEKDQEKIDDALSKQKKILEGMQNPQRTFQDAIPRLRGKLFR